MSAIILKINWRRCLPSAVAAFESRCRGRNFVEIEQEETGRFPESEATKVSPSPLIRLVEKLSD